MPHTSFESIRKAKEKGIAVYLTAFFLLMMIPIVGLSIDGGYAFVIQERLSAAADSSALAAGRGINLNGTVAAADAQATTQATNFFNSDFPSGYMNTSTSNRVVTPTFTVNKDTSGNPTGTLTIQVTASVIAPTYFMQWLGIPNLTVTASGTATRKNLVMEIVLDTSASMGTRSAAQLGHIPTSLATTDTSCQAMVYATSEFITYFSPYDTVGAITFDLTVYDDNNAGTNNGQKDGSYTASTNYWESGSGGMDNSLENIQCGSNTNTTAAIYRAYEDIITVNQKLAQNVIVLFTDGVPNAVNATFPVRTYVDARMSPAQGCTTTNGFPTSSGTTGVPTVDNGCSGGGCFDQGGAVQCTSTTTSFGTTSPAPQLCSTAGNAATGCKAGAQSAGGSSPGGLPVCTITASQFVTAAIAQWANFDVNGGQRGAAATFWNSSAPAEITGCSDYTTQMFTSQTIAYIPNSDTWSDSFINIQTGTSSTATSPWFQWIYGDTDATADHVNYTCAPSSVTITYGNSSCKNLGDFWTSHSTLGIGADNNTFQTGPYTGYLRPDTPNSIGTASMTAATNMAYKIRSDTTYNPVIDVVYLQGNGSDPVDRSFLQLVSNQQYIQPLVYQSNPACPNGALANAANASTCVASGGTMPAGTFTNPYFQSSQQQGLWEQTADTLQLESMFQAIASSLLRISQ
jgi:hypothetical protein